MTVLYVPNSLDSEVRMCSGSEVGSYVRRIDFVYHSTPRLESNKEEEEVRVEVQRAPRLLTQTPTCLLLTLNPEPLNAKPQTPNAFTRTRWT